MAKVAVVLVTANPSHDTADDTADDAFLVKVDGREAALRAVELVTNREPIGQVLLVVHSAFDEAVRRRLGSHLMFMGVKLVVADGGWYAQLRAAAAKVDPDASHVLVHDAARPATPYTDLDGLLASPGPATALALRVRGTLAAATAVPGPGEVADVRVAVVQTPRLYDRAVFAATADRAAEPVPLALVEGSPLNVRCGDVPAEVVEAMAKLLPKPKVAAASPFEEAQW